MKSEKRFTVTLRKQTTVGPEWKKQQAALENKAPDGSLPIKAHVSPVQKTGHYWLATFNGVGEEKVFARIDDWNGATEEEIKTVAAGDNFVESCTLDASTGTAVIVYQWNPEEVLETDKNSAEVKLIPEITEVIERRSKEGKLSADELSDRAYAMVRGGVPQKYIVNVLESVDITRPSMKKPTEYVDPEMERHIKAKEPTLLYRALASFQMGYAKILKGPKSTGKNTFINWVTWIMNVPQTEHTATMQDTRSDYMANEITDNTAVETLRHMKAELLVKKALIIIKAVILTILNTVTLGAVHLEISDDDKEALAQLFLYDRAKAEAASVHITYEYAAMAKWIMQGGVFVLNEANMAEANLLVGLLHPILDGSITSFPIPGVGDVELGKNLVLYMTMNPGYVGEQDMNEATVSRLGAYELAQPKSIRMILEKAVEHELSLYGVTKPLDPECFEQAVNFYDQINIACTEKDQDISDSALNIRGMVRAMSSYGRFKDMPLVTLRSFMRDEVITPVNDDTERTLLESILKHTITM